jgi:hypothetical protein
LRSSAHEGFANIGNVLQQIRRSLEIPVCRVDVAARVKSSCGLNEAVDLPFRVDVRGAALLAAPKILHRRQFVPIILGADMAGKAADCLQSGIPLRRRWPLSGPVDRGLRTDMRFVPLGGEAGKTWPG